MKEGRVFAACVISADDCSGEIFNSLVSRIVERTALPIARNASEPIRPKTPPRPDACIDPPWIATEAMERLMPEATLSIALKASTIARPTAA